MEFNNNISDKNLGKVETDIQKKNIQKNKNVKKKNILLRVFIALSVVSIILILLFTVYGYNNAGSIDGFSTSGFALLIPFFFIPAALVYIWGLYVVIIIVRFLYKKNIILMLLFIIAFVFFLLNLFGIINVSSEKYDLNEVFYEPLVISEDKIYYNVLEFNNSSNIISMLISDLFSDEPKQNSINSMSLDGKNNQVICKDLIQDNVTDEEDDFLYFQHFYFIRNNELFYKDDSYNNSLGKINLSNCKVTNFNFDGELLQFIDDDIYLDDSDKIIKYNVVTDTKNEKKFYNDNLYNLPIIDYKNFDIYYIAEISNDSEREFGIFKNNDLLFSIKQRDLLEPLTLTNNYLFFYDDKTIYQLDINNKKIVNQFGNKYKDIYVLVSDTVDNYFTADDRIYRYNEQNNEFQDILGKELSKEYTFYTNVYHHNNKIHHLSNHYLMRLSLLGV